MSPAISELWRLNPTETFSIISRRQSNLLSKKLSERTDILITTLRRDCVHGIAGLGKQPLGPLNSRLSHEIERRHVGQLLKAPEESTKTHICGGSCWSGVTLVASSLQQSPDRMFSTTGRLEATRRIAAVVSQVQEIGEIDPGVSTIGLSRFILNSLYGAIFRSKTDRTERPMKLLQQFALDPFVIKQR
jgi:hypothetical protein